MEMLLGRQAPRLVILMMLALLASLASLLWLSERGYDQRTELVRETSQARDRQMHASRLLIAVTEGESAMRGFLVAGDPSLREPLEDAKRDANALLDQLDASAATATPGARTALVELRKLVEQRFAQFDRRMERFRLGGIEAVRDDPALTATEGLRTAEAIRVQARLFEAAESDALVDTLEQWGSHLRRVRIAMALLTALSVVLLLVTGVLIYRQWQRGATQTSELQEQVRMGVSELAALSSHLQYISEREKQALARELHDALGGLLVATKMDVAWIRNHLDHIDPAIEQRFVRIQSSLDQGVDFKRRVVEQLRPTLLDNMGLFAALRWQFQDTCNRASLKCNADLPEQELVLTSDAAIALFRVAQEALTNILKHARASAAWLSVAVEGETLHMTIADNGRGMPAQAAAGSGQGLAGIRHRVTALGGTVLIRPWDHAGTELVIRVPMARVTSPVTEAPPFNGEPPAQPFNHLASRT
jgi:signal transduction histidine kinase